MIRQKEYFERYSEDRYDMNHLVLLTPQRKYYGYDFDYSIPLAEGTDKTILNLISKIVRYTTRISRYDVLSRYNDHNSSPSARNYHSSEIYFVFKDKSYRYNYFKDRLEIIEQKSRLFKDDRLYILGVSDVYNLSRFYSEFSFYLVGLDSGHVAYNAKTVLFDEGIKSFQLFNYDQQFISEELNRSKKDTVINYVIGCEVGSLLNDLEYIKEKNLKDKEEYRYTKPDFDQLIATDHLRNLMDEVKINDYVNNFEIPVTYYPEDMMETHRNRNSLHNVLGNFNPHIGYESFDAKVLTEKIADYISKTDYARKLNFRIISKDSNHIDQDEARNKDESCKQSWVPKEELQNVLHNDHAFLDLRTFNHVVVVYSTDGDILDVGLQNLLLGVGEVMQIACLYSAENGYGFRPLKNHNDGGIKNILGLDHKDDKILYIGLLGCNSTNCLSYHI